MRVWLSKKENKNVLALVRTFTDPAFASVCQKGQAIRLQPLLVSAITPPPVESASSSEAATMAVTAAAKGSLKPIIHKKGAAFDLSRPHKSRVSNFYLRLLTTVCKPPGCSRGAGIVGNKKLLAAKFLLTYH